MALSQDEDRHLTGERQYRPYRESVKPIWARRQAARVEEGGEVIAQRSSVAARGRVGSERCGSSPPTRVWHHMPAVLGAGMSPVFLQGANIIELDFCKS